MENDIKGVTLKFVKGAYLSTYRNTTDPDCRPHVLQVDQLLRIKSKTKPSVGPLPEIDLQPALLAAVRKVRIRAPEEKGEYPACKNNHFGEKKGLASLHYDMPLHPEASLISIEVYGGTICYPNTIVALPNIPGKHKPFGWIQVDFERGPVTLELFSATGAVLGTFSVYDGQAFDIAGFVMYKNEASSLDDEIVILKRQQAAGGSDYEKVEFKVLEQGDGTGGGAPPN